jgi:hypothetical protein
VRAVSRGPSAAERGSSQHRVRGVRNEALRGGREYIFRGRKKLSAGGDPKSQQSGWLKDRFGVSWQVVPRGMAEMLRDPGSEGARRAMMAMLHMKKIDVAELKRAYAG